MKRTVSKANGYTKTQLLYAGIDGFPRRVYKKDDKFFVEYLNLPVNVTNKIHRFVGSFD